MLKHSQIEKSILLMGILTTLAIIWGGLVQITPLFTEKSLTEVCKGAKPRPALQLAGFNIYVREGCYNCHSQMIRPFRWETERYGAYSLACESVYDRPFQWGSKRTGPDLARVGGRYSDEWHHIHLVNPRQVVPESIMPGFPWLEKAKVDGKLVTDSMKALRTLGQPYTDADIAGAAKAVEGKTQIEAVIAYLQGLGLGRTLKR
ncbi:MAG: cytochrome-c oxidase, cbb3-type subunit II [Ostreibacterium sp.]